MQWNGRSALCLRTILVLPLLVCAACSSGERLIPVAGKVLHQGKEIKGAVVTFHPKDADPAKATPPVGMTNENGVFTLSTGKHAGAPPGHYVVTIIWLKEIPSLKEKKKLSISEGPDIQDFFNGAYADPKKSTFKVEIKAGETNLEPFRLD